LPSKTYFWNNIPVRKYSPKLKPTHNISLNQRVLLVNNTDVEAPNPGSKPKFDMNCNLVPQI